MLEFFTYAEVNRGRLKMPWRSGLWTAVRRLTTPDLSPPAVPSVHFQIWKTRQRLSFWRLHVFRGGFTPSPIQVGPNILGFDLDPKICPTLLKVPVPQLLLQ